MTDPNGQQCDSLDSAGYCPGDDPPTCSTVLDPTGYNNGPLDVNRAIGFLTAMLLFDGIGNITDGTPSADDAQILDNMAAEFGGIGQGDKLADDASQFASDEQSYDPDNPSSVDLAYAHPLISDILALQRDCPAGEQLGIQMLHST